MEKVQTKVISAGDITEETSKRIAKIQGRLYVSAFEAGQKSKVSPDMIWYLLRLGRVKGAYRIAGTWIIPASWRYKRIARKKKILSPLALQDPSKR